MTLSVIPNVGTATIKAGSGVLTSIVCGDLKNSHLDGTRRSFTRSLLDVDGFDENESS